MYQAVARSSAPLTVHITWLPPLDYYQLEDITYDDDEQFYRWQEDETSRFEKEENDLLIIRQLSLKIQ